jgi:hypothetical protein
MGIESTFIHTCTISRDNVTGTDAHNNAVTESAIITTDQPCRLIEKTRTLFQTATSEALVTSEYKLFIGAGVDLQEHDHVTIILEDGIALTWDFHVVKLLRRRGGTLHHLSAMLEVVR